MNITSVPIIVICCYITGEIYKGVFCNKKETYKYIPIFLVTLGGVLGGVIYFTAPQMIFGVNNVWSAIGIGITSGASSTGANQIIKQIFSEGEK